jgi:hypothetical protein
VTAFGWVWSGGGLVASVAGRLGPRAHGAPGGVDTSVGHQLTRRVVGERPLPSGDADRRLTGLRAAIDLALSHGHGRAATKPYQHLADTLEHAADYRRARATYVEATRLCRANESSATADFCLVCLSSMVPTRVSHSRPRWPLRWVTRPSERS